MKTHLPRLTCQVTSTDTTIAVPDGMAATIKPNDLIEIDPETWSAETVRVEQVVRFLGRDEALLTVERAGPPHRATGHSLGAEMRRV